MIRCFALFFVLGLLCLASARLYFLSSYVPLPWTLPTSLGRLSFRYNGTLTVGTEKIAFNGSFFFDPIRADNYANNILTTSYPSEDANIVRWTYFAADDMLLPPRVAPRRKAVLFTSVSSQSSGFGIDSCRQAGFNMSGNPLECGEWASRADPHAANTIWTRSCSMDPAPFKGWPFEAFNYLISVDPSGAIVELIVNLDSPISFAPSQHLSLKAVGSAAWPSGDKPWMPLCR